MEADVEIHNQTPSRESGIQLKRGRRKYMSKGGQDHDGGGSHLLIVVLIVWGIGVIFRKWSSVPMHSSVLLLSLLWGSVWLVLCWGLRSIWTWVLCMAIDVDLFAFFYLFIVSYVSTIYWICFFFPIYNLSFFVKNQVFVGLWIDISVFNSIPLVFSFANTRLLPLL